MIFVTVGTQLPFDRLIQAVDDWAGQSGRSDVFAQIGPSSYVPKHIEHAPFIDPEQCRERTREAAIIVAHAGMGTIISALELGKPLVVMPRRAHLGEHRSDHQMATAEQFGQRPHVTLAHDAKQLAQALDRMDEMQSAEPIQSQASEALLGAIREFIGLASAQGKGPIDD